MGRAAGRNGVTIPAGAANISRIPSRMRLWLVAAIAITIGGCGSAPPDRNAEVRIAIGGRAALDFVPIYLADSLGFFRQEGLQVTLQDLPGTAKAIQALMGRSSDVVAGGYDAAIEMTVQGQPMQAIATIEKWPPLVVVAAARSDRQLRTILDLKGAVVGVSSPGSSSHHLINYLLEKNGLASSDIRTVGVGVNFSMAAAIQGGKVDAAVAGPLGMALLSKTPGLVILADCRTAEGALQTLGTANFPWTVLMTRPEWTRSHPETASKLGRAVHRTLVWIHQHSAEDVSNAMPQQYKGQDAALYLKGIRDILPAFSDDGIMPAGGPSHVKDFLGVSDDRVRDANIDLEATYTNKFVGAR
jgi:NitT/TauT family transport system substrate-binding protein